MAVRFYCEKSELMAGLALNGQAWFDPYVGIYDPSTGGVPTGNAICNPAYKRPMLSTIGTTDMYYGSS